MLIQQLVFACFLFVVVGYSTAAIICKGGCKSSKIYCPDPYSYQFCQNTTNDYAITTTAAKKCGDGTICDDAGGFFPCKKGTVTTTTTTTTTTTQAPETVPTCNQQVKLPASEPDEYYQCTATGWWIFTSWTAVLTKCPEGTTFDANLADCTTAAAVLSGVEINFEIVTTENPLNQEIVEAFSTFLQQLFI